MVSPTGARESFNQALIEFAGIVRFRYFTVSGADANYDNDVTLTQSGPDIYVSGINQPLDKMDGTQDAVLMQQGKLLNNDRRLYVAGSVDTSGLWKLAIGSPTGDEYSLATEDGGVTAWSIADIDIYKKIYLRRLTTGSLAEE